MDNGWIPVSVKPAEDEGEVLLYNKKWVDEDFNPKGIRIGYYNACSGWTSAYWLDEYDDYSTAESDIDNFHAPTHWMKLPSFKDNICTEPKE